MLKLKTLLPIGLLAFSSTSFAEFIGPGSQPKPIEVIEVNEVLDDQKVALQGNIIQQTDDDEFIFKDASGEMEIEIDQDKFANITVTPEDEVLIIGEADVDVFETTIEAEELQLVAQ